MVKNLVQSTTLAVATLLGSHAEANSPEPVQITREAPAQIETSSVSETCDEITAEQPTIPLATTTHKPNISWFQNSPVSKKIHIDSDGKADISRMYGKTIDHEELSEHNTKLRIRGDILEVLFTKEDGSILIVASMRIHPSMKDSIASQVDEQNAEEMVKLSEKTKDVALCVATVEIENLTPPPAESHPVLTEQTEKASWKNAIIPAFGLTTLFAGMLAGLRRRKKESSK